MSQQTPAIGGTIVAVLPNAIYRVELADGRQVLAHVGSRFRLNVVRLLPGDQVTIEFMPYDSGRGRIVARQRGVEQKG